MQNNYTICFINMQALFAYLYIKFLNEYTQNFIMINNTMYKYKNSILSPILGIIRYYF